MSDSMRPHGPTASGGVLRHASERIVVKGRECKFNMLWGKCYIDDGNGAELCRDAVWREWNFTDWWPTESAAREFAKKHADHAEAASETGGREVLSHRQLFLDCDGVLADFDAAFVAKFGHPPRDYEEKHGSEVFWRDIKAECPTFYRDLPLMPDAMELFEAVKHLRPIILTGVPRGEWAELQKIAWAAEHFPGVPIQVCKARDKSAYLRPGDVLIDDRTQYRERWEKAGGVFIHHTSAKSSLEQLRGHWHPAPSDAAELRAEVERLRDAAKSAGFEFVPVPDGYTCIPQSPQVLASTVRSLQDEKETREQLLEDWIARSEGQEQQIAALTAQLKSIGIVPYLERMKELTARAESAEADRDKLRGIIKQCSDAVLAGIPSVCLVDELPGHVEDLVKLRDEYDQLRAKLAEVERERDGWMQLYNLTVDKGRNDLATVTASHNQLAERVAVLEGALQDAIREVGQRVPNMQVIKDALAAKGGAEDGK